MKSINELINQYYEEFKCIGPTPIVRNNTPNDAFELVVLKILYGKFLPDFTKNNINVFAKYIVAPPDNGIDIFYQHEEGDEYRFDVIQVKNTVLQENDLRKSIAEMQRTIDDYCKNPKHINSDTCKEILSNSELNKNNKNRCTYYVIHTGDTTDFSGSKENEKILTSRNLEIIFNNIQEYVDKDTLNINQNMSYGKTYDSNGAIVCSLNGYELAELCNKYFQTEAGRNILFGSNLRESLVSKKSKTYQSMSKTITECPENFWYYNNGITIIAKEIIVDENNKTEVTLENFSIVNGAQTTSSLGEFLKEARKNKEYDKIDSLKKVFVLTRILKISDNTMRQDIAIFNNTQNPITSRDMVANRPEQKQLHKWLLDDSIYPQIYVETRRGAKIPGNFDKSITHRRTTNEELAQLAYAGFKQEPFTAKDKKSALFNNDYTQDFVINEIYHDVFNYDEKDSSKNGILFQKSKTSIDELLFAQQLYKEAKKSMRNRLIEKIAKEQQKKLSLTDEKDIQSCDKRIEQHTLHLDTVGICMFYFITLYYEFKETFDTSPDNTIFNFEMYYRDKSFKEKLIRGTEILFLELTTSILVKTAKQANKAANLNNWVRSKSCEPKFIEELRDVLANQSKYEDEYNEYVTQFKITKS